jgi:hypothetical protein
VYVDFLNALSFVLENLFSSKIDIAFGNAEVSDFK